AADVNRDYAVDGLDIASMLQVALGEEKYFSTRPATGFFEWVGGSFTWEEAKADAEARGGQLASIYSQDQNDEIQALLWDNGSNASGWVGLTGELVIHDIVVNDGVNLSTERLEIQASPVDLDAGAIVGFPNGEILLDQPLNKGDIAIAGSISGAIYAGQSSDPIEVTMPGGTFFDIDNWAGSSGYPNNVTYDIFQSFTIGSEGALKEIQVELSSARQAGDVFTYDIDLYQGHGSIVGGVASFGDWVARVPATFTNGSTLVSFTFDPPIPVMVGEAYTFRFDYTEAYPGEAPTFRASGGDTYPGGDFYVHPGYGLYDDLRFRTIMETEPSTELETIVATYDATDGTDASVDVIATSLAFEAGETLQFPSASLTLSADAPVASTHLTGELVGTISTGHSMTVEEDRWTWQDGSDVSLFFKGAALTNIENEPYVSVNTQGEWIGNGAGGVRDGYVLQVGGASIYQQPKDQEVYETDTAVFKVAARGAGVLNYQWQRNGENIPGGTSSHYVVPAAMMDHDGDQYRVIVTSGGISVVSSVATLKVRLDHSEFRAVQLFETDPGYSRLKQEADLPAGSYTWVMVTDKYVDGDTASPEYQVMTIEGGGTPTLAPEVWKIDAQGRHVMTTSVSFPGNATGPILFPATNQRPRLFARVSLLNDRGKEMLVNSYFDNMDEAWTTDGGGLDWLGWRNHPDSITVEEGFAASFHVGVGGGPHSYEWSRDGVVIPGATGATLTLPLVTLADDGAVFTVTKSDEPNVAIPPATLTVTPNSDQSSYLILEKTAADNGKIHQFVDLVPGNYQVNIISDKAVELQSGDLDIVLT
ncbi:MAG: hypothetical protein ACO3PR_09280, partial [Limisphaerales bacterium]